MVSASLARRRMEGSGRVRVRIASSTCARFFFVYSFFLICFSGRCNISVYSLSMHTLHTSIELITCSCTSIIWSFALVYELLDRANFLFFNLNGHIYPHAAVCCGNKNERKKRRLHLIIFLHWVLYQRMHVHLSLSVYDSARRFCWLQYNLHRSLAAIRIFFSVQTAYVSTKLSYNNSGNQQAISSFLEEER